MLYKRKYYLILLFTLAMILLGFQVAQAQDWVAMPPYNALWPLWSPVLSPLNAAGIPTPLISEITSSTILPLQPGLVWDPTWWTLAGPDWGWPMGFQPPWLLYNGPAGLLFFDVLYGLKPWPPVSYVDPVTGLPAPVALPPAFALFETTPETLPTTKAIYLFELANLSYLVGYGGALGINYPSLLTAADVFGLPPQ